MNAIPEANCPVCLVRHKLYSIDGDWFVDGCPYFRSIDQIKIGWARFFNMKGRQPLPPRRQPKTKVKVGIEDISTGEL